MFSIRLLFTFFKRMSFIITKLTLLINPTQTDCVRRKIECTRQSVSVPCVRICLFWKNRNSYRRFFRLYSEREMNIFRVG